MERIRLTVACGVSLFAAVPAFAASCDPGRAPTVPVIKNLPYKQARTMILADGWRAVPGQPHGTLSDNEATFRERGYTELQFCRLNADSLCRFEFASQGGVLLWVTTTGDENPALDSQAVVKAARLSCLADGDPG